MFKSIRTFIVAASCSIGFAASSSASIVINIGTFLRDQSGADLTGGTLIQLINLGADGVFNDITLGDGALAQWVGGDDSLLNCIISPGSAPDFANTNAFDLFKGADATPGLMDRTFIFDTGTLAQGLKLGIRWFPGLAAASFDTLTLQNGQRFGQFTRQTSPINGGDIPWVTPAEGANVSFDPLIPANLGGADPDSASVASFVVPEPTAIGMSLIGAAGLALLRRRRP